MEGASSSSSTRFYGVALALLAVAASAPSPALLRSLQKGGTHSARRPLKRFASFARAHLRSLSRAGLPDVVIFCWKFLLAALVQFFFVLWGRGGPPSLKCLCGCWKWVAIGAVCTTGAAFNTISNLETTSVSALLFFYAAPLWALCFGVLYCASAPAAHARRRRRRPRGRLPPFRAEPPQHDD